MKEAPVCTGDTLSLNEKRRQLDQLAASANWQAIGKMLGYSTIDTEKGDARDCVLYALPDYPDAYQSPFIEDVLRNEFKEISKEKAEDGDVVGYFDGKPWAVHLGSLKATRRLSQGSVWGMSIVTP